MFRPRVSRSILLDTGELFQIVSPSWPSNCFTIAATVNFGASHLSCRKGGDHIISFKRGVAHMVEHLLLKGWNAHWCALERKFAVSVNAHTCYDTTTITVDGAIDSHCSIQDLPVITAELLRPLVGGFTEHVKMRVDDVRSEISQEISYRFQETEYRMRAETLDALFWNHPLRYDILGTTESIAAVEDIELDAAMAIVRRNIAGITVISGAIEIDRLEDIICGAEPFLRQNADDEFAIEPLEPAEERLPARISRRASKTYAGNATPVCLGTKVQYHQNVDSRMEDWRQHLLYYLLSSHFGKESVPGITTKTGAVLFAHGYAEDPLFFLDEQQYRDVIATLRASICAKLSKIRRYLGPRWKMVGLEIMENRRALLSICELLAPYQLSVMNISNMDFNIVEHDIDNVLSSITEEKENTAFMYASPMSSVFAE